jgi:hypothetical protein
MTLDQCGHMAVERPADQIALPMSGNGSILDFRRSFADGNDIYDFALSVPVKAGAPRAADPPLLQLAVRGQQTRLGPQGPLPGLLITFVGSILRAPAMAGYVSARCGGRATQTLGDGPHRADTGNSAGDVFAFGQRFHTSAHWTSESSLVSRAHHEHHISGKKDLYQGVLHRWFEPAPFLGN